MNTGFPDANDTLCMSSMDDLGLSSTMNATNSLRFADMSRIRRRSASFSWKRPSAMIRPALELFVPASNVFPRAQLRVERFEQTDHRRIRQGIILRERELRHQRGSALIGEGRAERVERSHGGGGVLRDPPVAASSSSSSEPDDANLANLQSRHARANNTMDSSARWPHAFSAMDLESSMASTTWYRR